MRVASLINPHLLIKAMSVFYLDFDEKRRRFWLELFLYSIWAERGRGLT
jgi:hypothetical protein